MYPGGYLIVLSPFQAQSILSCPAQIVHSTVFCNIMANTPSTTIPAAIDATLGLVICHMPWDIANRLPTV